MRRVRIGGFLAAATLLGTAPVGLAHGDSGPMVRVDIYRAQSDGAMNAVPCIITIAGDAKGSVCHEVIRAEKNKSLSGGRATVLLGGDRVICELNPSNSVQAFTPRALRPDEYAPDARTWQATTLAPKVHAGKTLELTVVPQAKGRTYVGGWLLRPSKPAAPHARR